MGMVAVFDVGKTNVKLSAASADGVIVETLSAPNVVRDGPPYRHHDLAALEEWLIDGLSSLAGRFDIDAIAPCAHGSGGVLVDPDGAAMPMIDYEQSLPADVEKAYPALAGPFSDRGSGIMLGAAHLARQMLWIEMHWPERFHRAHAFLATPQYWAWRLCGVPASEVTSLSAQSHLWSPAGGCPAALVAKRKWQRLIPPLRPAWDTLGRLKPDIAARTGLAPGTRVLCGIHDSSANFYRYQAAGLSDLTVVSTGTWIVALTDREAPDPHVEKPGRTCNADVFGRPVPGMLTMGGREFSAITAGSNGPASRQVLEGLVRSRALAVPFFGSDDGLFPGAARRGRIEGLSAEDPGARFTLGVLSVALLTAECIEALPPAETVVLDGSFVQDPLYGACVAALLPHMRVLVSRSTTGTATGAALLASHTIRREPAPLELERPEPLHLPELTEYRACWRARAKTMETHLDRV
ncbi:FGGY-family carbohydrate kinase [Microvirga sp. TS319]|uniref:FGGY-family carbohydrate kinase n=1 Tax=Microvirga sp. TS319 TaxID=3241165 RepID=UPI00351A8CEC